MWHFPQFSGRRDCAGENWCRAWQAEQAPLLPSGLMRPMPVLGQVAGSSRPLASTRTVEPWHFWHPPTAAGTPSTTTPRKLSRLPMKRAALAWWLAVNSLACWAWHFEQSLGETMTATREPSCCQASLSSFCAWWQSRQPTPSCAWRLSRHWATMPGDFSVWQFTHPSFLAVTMDFLLRSGTRRSLSMRPTMRREPRKNRLRTATIHCLVRSCTGFLLSS